MADFFERTSALADMVGDGDLTGTFAVEKVYAAVQHEGGWLNHMGRNGPVKIKKHTDGGKPPRKFVEDPLKRNYAGYYQHLADSVLNGTIRDAMKDNMKHQDRELKASAPELSGSLKNSGSYTVTDNGRVVARKLSIEPYEGD